MEMEQLRQFIVAVVGREEVGCASGSGADGQWMIKLENAMRKMLGELISAWEEVTDWKETGCKESKETVCKETGRKEIGERWE